MMAGIRRWYIYLVSLVSLQALTWGLIALLRNVLVYGRRPGIAFETQFLSWQIAIVLVTLPVFLVHWLWGQRLAQREAEERTSWERGLYLYGVIASFLAPIVANGYELLQTLFQLLLNVEPGFRFSQLTPDDRVLYHLIPIIILSVLWFYHYRLAASPPPQSPLRTAQRWTIFGFAAAGLTMTTLGVIALLRWLLLQMGDTAVVNTISSLPAELARLTIGIPLWLLFWRQAQQLFSKSEAEQRSTLRKFYLYLVIFVMALTAVAAATGILAGILRRLLSLTSVGDIREPIAIIVVTAALWAYHARVLQQDIRASREQPKQATIRRLYWYLVAAVGLAAFLVGFGGDISVLIRSLTGSVIVSELREQLAWFTAALVAGLPVWLWPWRQIQVAAAAVGNVGNDERDAIVRKIYLYFYIFVATMTVLASAIYIVYRLVSLILGDSTGANLANELSHAIAYALMAIAVWLYHGAVLRSDGRLTVSPALPDSLRVVVVDRGDGRLGQSLLTALQQALPFATLQAVGFTPAVAETGNDHTPESILAEAELIVGSWTMALPDEADGVTTAVFQSPARKLLIPTRQEGWEWVGVESWNLESIIDETIQSSRQIALGGAVKQQRAYDVGTIIVIIAGVLGLLIVMSVLVGYFFNYLF